MQTFVTLLYFSLTKIRQGGILLSLILWKYLSRRARTSTQIQPTSVWKEVYITDRWRRTVFHGPLLNVSLSTAMAMYSTLDSFNWNRRFAFEYVVRKADAIFHHVLLLSHQMLFSHLLH